MNSQSPSLDLLNQNLQTGTKGRNLYFSFLKSIIGDSDSALQSTDQNLRTIMYTIVSNVSFIHSHPWTKDFKLIIIYNLIYSLNQPYLQQKILKDYLKLWLDTFPDSMIDINAHKHSYHLSFPLKNVQLRTSAFLKKKKSGRILRCLFFM